MRVPVLYRLLLTQISPAKPIGKNTLLYARVMSTSSSIPQIRALSHSDDKEPAFKKPRLEITQEDLATNVENLMEELDATAAASVSLSELEGGTGLHSTDRKPRKKKKRKDPPLPEPCSGADVQYQEIRELLGGDVVDSVTEAGNAFQSPFSHTEEVTVTIESLGSGGALYIWCGLKHIQLISQPSS